MSDSSSDRKARRVRIIAWVVIIALVVGAGGGVVLTMLFA